MSYWIKDHPTSRGKNASPGFSGVISGLRYYSPELGRWISRDPIGERGGVNIYGFVLNNPIIFWDEFGLMLSSFSEAGDKDDPKFCDNYKKQLDERYHHMKRAASARKVFFASKKSRTALEVSAIYGDLSLWGFGAFSSARELIGDSIVNVLYTGKNPIDDFLVGAGLSMASQRWLDEYLRQGIKTSSSGCKDAVTELVNVTKVSVGSKNMFGWWARWDSQVKTDCPCLHKSEKDAIEKWKDHWWDNKERMKKEVSRAEKRVSKKCGVK